MISITARPRKNGTVGHTAQVRVWSNGVVAAKRAKTFNTEREARRWGVDMEKRLQALAMLPAAQGQDKSLGDLIRRYLEEFGAGASRSKAYALRGLAKWPIADKLALQVSAEDIIEHARLRRRGGALPATITNDIVSLRVIYRTAPAAWSVPLRIDVVLQAAFLLRAERIIGRAARRERRPTPEELATLDDFFARRDDRAEIPMQDIMWFAVHSARREAEITRVTWSGLNVDAGTLDVRDIKHPKGKGYHRTARLTAASLEILRRQPREKGEDRIFPYNPRSVSAAFTRACKACGIRDLRFHDLRHEATSRLFETGYSIVEVQHFSLHESWDQLRRYTNLRPADIALR